jgi:hypothetical protein
MIESSPRGARWKVVLLVLCGVAIVLTFVAGADAFGLGGKPWYGWWDSNVRPLRPYVVAFSNPIEGGATARAGIRNGDELDLRQQNEASRVAVLYQLMGTQPTPLNVRRGSTTHNVAVTGTSVWETQTGLKFATMVSYTLASIWFVACALLIALRRSKRRDGVLLALALLGLVGNQMNPSYVVVPSASVQLALLLGAQACMSAALILLVRLSAQFGTRSRWRLALEWASYGAALLVFANDVAFVIGVHTLVLDPAPFALRVSAIPGAFALAAALLVALSAVVAVATTPRSERPRAAWTVLPLPVALVIEATIVTFEAFVLQSWYAVVAVAVVADALWLVGAGAVTYAMLKRRVLDLEFVLTRTLVVGIVSAIVVTSFVLLEWLLGTVLAGVSHATGLIANGALALVLGLSLNPIHRRVDGAIESLLFRKRYEDERALLDFSKEAAYVTSSEALLDEAIEKLRHHTDARGAAILVDGAGEYSAIRSFGAHSPHAISENDSALLALKTWHKPVDPHQYRSAILAALAVPMLARGRLLGVVVLGERAGGEAYAPDEVEALAQFAHGVGSALDIHSVRRDDSIANLRDSLAAMADAIAALGNEMASLKRSIVPR